ncbi:MAG: sigma-54-dependent Fis family transcriptional regulator [Candidatus Krumholzibacteria bacterium]|nr:sigma-54-dependent Fis family transcriptional regulator [Candidatus Krumholzibacteria bacterium]
MSRILIVDDEKKITQLLADHLEKNGYTSDIFHNAEDAMAAIDSEGADIVLCDLRLPGMDGLQLLKETRKISPATDFIIMTAYASASTAVEAMREGAYEYLIKPFQMDEVILLLKRIHERRELMIENIALKEKISARTPGEKIIGSSAVMKKLKDIIARVAPTDTAVLIHGESGTGKELVAAEIHSASSRSTAPFIVINCAAIPETLIESELFGYEKGAFTGAVQNKPGQFKLAHRGSLFLDEIGELPMALQAKLLRAIDNGSFLPLGSSKVVTVDVRIIAATNRDLEKMVSERKFREDLLYRLNVFPVSIPPLRDRKEDIRAISEDFLATRRFGDPHLSEEVIGKLRSYSWPGNVRELRNILERGSILAGTDPIGLDHIMISGTIAPGRPDDILSSIVGEMRLADIEQSLIRIAIEKTGGNKSRAAEMLGITRRKLYSRMEKYEMNAENHEAERTNE